MILYRNLNNKKMKKIIGLFALLLMVFAMSFTSSEFYSSLTKVDYVEGSKTLKFSTKLNSAHISQVLKINPNTTAFEAEVKRYVNDHVDVAVNGQNRPLTFTGSQVNGETVWVYYEAGGISDISSIRIKNNIRIIKSNNLKEILVMLTINQLPEEYPLPLSIIPQQNN